MPDRSSVEERIIIVLKDSGGTADPVKIREKLSSTTGANEMQGAIQSLLDRGDVEVTRDWKLHTKV